MVYSQQKCFFMTVKKLASPTTAVSYFATTSIVFLVLLAFLANSFELLLSSSRGQTVDLIFSYLL